MPHFQQTLPQPAFVSPPPPPAPPEAPSSPPRPPQAPRDLRPVSPPVQLPDPPHSTPKSVPTSGSLSFPSTASQAQLSVPRCTLLLPSSQGPVASPLTLPPPLCSAPGTCLPLPAPPRLHRRQLLLLQAALTFLVVLPYLLAPFSNPRIQVMKVR